jgi:glycosyltransferase involved in cell wall biosynthesis
MRADHVRMETGHRPYRVFTPRWMDENDTNAQNSNARAMLSRFSDPRACWIAVRGEDPPERILANPAVETHRLSTSRWWPFELALEYQWQFDAIFYPGPNWADKAGFLLRRFAGRGVPVIATLEGIIAGMEDLRRISQVVGHPVFGQPGADAAVPRIRWMYETSTHIIAISPFLARVASTLYGDKVSCLPLGIEAHIFHSKNRREPTRCRVVGCGTVKSSKRPQFFLNLARRYPEADFVWFGDGEMRPPLMAEATKMGLPNLTFPGGISPDRLAEEFRNSSLFVLPSQAEGVPKVTQEASACGLPVALYGFYEAPSVVHQQNGLLAWSEQELLEQVGLLIGNREMRFAMGHCGAEMALRWSWDDVAHQWEELLIHLVSQPSYPA